MITHMVTKVLKTIEEFGMLRRGERVLCALSGGADSSVLLDVFMKCSHELGITVCAAHLNHMLRGKDADEDESFVREKCEKLGVPLICERTDVAAVAEKTGQSAELAARNVRYEFLYRAKESLGAIKIATAHNANDNLETVIFNLCRGGGLDGLCGIPPVRGDIIRPLIAISRGEIEQYAREFAVSFCEDKTNADTVYSRNKIRHGIIPVMLEINPAAVGNAARSSEILREDSAFLKASAQLAAEKIALDGALCQRDELLKLHSALFGRVCEIFARCALGEDNYTLEHRHICDIRDLCKNTSPSKEINLPSGLCVRCEYGKLLFEKKQDEQALFPLVVSEGELSFGKYKISVKKTVKTGKIHNSVNTFCIPCGRIQDSLIVRKRQEGDEIKITRRPKKSLKKLFIDERVPKSVRDSIPVIADGKAVVAVSGFGQDERYLPSDNDEILLIEIN